MTYRTRVLALLVGILLLVRGPAAAAYVTDDFNDGDITDSGDL